MTTDELDRIRRQFVEAGGHATQSLGFGRLIGQIYLHAYFSPEPLTLDDLTRDLGISKGGASMAVRQLESWGALRRIWIKGDRKDYYEPLDDFGRIIRKALLDLVGRRMEDADQLLADADARLQPARAARGRAAEAEVLRERVARLRAFRRKAQGLWESPVIQLLLKK
jgi:DNA-binding transcriptional regulator GbsR (MarR family)